MIYNTSYVKYIFILPYDSFLGKMTIIVGKSGSGKTSLLAAILEEMRLISGDLCWNKYRNIFRNNWNIKLINPYVYIIHRNVCHLYSLFNFAWIWNTRYATIAYVQQNPWLLNTTIRENILFGEPYRPHRYEKVLISCSLKQDIDLMSAGDMTDISASGINLSGGQKQRIAIARALYSSANVVIFVSRTILHYRFIDIINIIGNIIIFDAFLAKISILW